jgi:hypothetical protein
MIRQFDRGRRGFSMTNVGISLTAELIEFSRKHHGNRLFAIRLNCAYAWPPLDATKSPMLTFLQIDPIREDGRRLRFFRRTGDYLRTWSDVSSAEWTSHGECDIFIRAEPDPVQASLNFETDIILRPGINIDVHSVAQSFRYRSSSESPSDPYSGDVQLDRRGPGLSFVLRVGEVVSIYIVPTVHYPEQLTRAGSDFFVKSEHRVPSFGFQDIGNFSSASATIEKPFKFQPMRRIYQQWWIHSSIQPVHGQRSMGRRAFYIDLDIRSLPEQLDSYPPPRPAVPIYRQPDYNYPDSIEFSSDEETLNTTGAQFSS